MAETVMATAFDVLRSFRKLERVGNGGGDRVLVEFPRWQCFCCHDTGIVQRPDLIVQDYGINDPEVVCTYCGIAVSRWGKEPTDEQLAKCGISRSEFRSGLEIRDIRAPREVCQALHEQNRSEWVVWFNNAVERKRQSQTPTFHPQSPTGHAGYGQFD